MLSLSSDCEPVGGWMNSNMDNPLKEILTHKMQKAVTESLLSEYEILVPRVFISQKSVGDDYVKAHIIDEWSVFIDVLDRYYGAGNHGLKEEKKFLLQYAYCKEESI